MALRANVIAFANLELHAHSLADAHRHAHTHTHTKGHKCTRKGGAPFPDTGVNQQQVGSGSVADIGIKTTQKVDYA